MSDFLNPLGGRFLGRTGPVAPISITGTIPDPPRSFQQLDPGTIIKGVVLGREADGQVNIATDKGTVRVASNAPLPPGTHVTLEVRPTGDRLQVLILASDAGRGPGAQPQPGTPPAQSSHGQPPAGIPAGPAEPASPPRAGAANPTAPTPQPPSPGSSNAPGQPAAGAPSTPPPGSGTGTAGGVSGGPAVPPPSSQAPIIQVVGASHAAIVLHPGALTPAVPGTAAGEAASPLRIQLPNGQVIVLPSGAAAPAPGAQANAAATPPISTGPAAAWQPPAGAAPVPQTPQPGQAPQAGQAPQVGQAPPAGQIPLAPPATPAASPAGNPAPAASLLPGEMQQRILALFAGTQAPAIQSGQLAPATPPALPASAELQLRVLAVRIGDQHPIQIDPAIGTAQQGRGAAGEAPIVYGRVIALTPAGHAIINTPVGTIMLQQRSSLPVGAQLALAIDVVEAPPPTAAAAALPVVQTPQQALLSLSRSWPTLADLIAILQGSAPHAAGKPGVDPAVMREVMASLPQIGARLGAGMVAAMAALRSGDIGRLLGPLFAARGLGAEREELVGRLRGEFQQLAALAQDRPEGEWRAFFLPYLDDQQRVQRINLFYRRHGRRGVGGEDGDGGTRFVVEASFSRLGAFQLDGLMRRNRFDLMVRSQQRLDERMRRDIEAIYEEARGLTGFAGAIAFQTVDEFPVAPLEELKQARDEVTI